MTRLLVKDGVQPRLVRLVAAAINAASGLGLTSLTITAGIDGTHGGDSLHYALRAIDIRTHDQPDKLALLAAIQHEAGPGHDCFLEAPGTPDEHIHLEFDPH